MTMKATSTRKNPIARTLLAATAVAAICSTVSAVPVRAQDNGFEQDIIRNFMRGLGLRDGQETGPEYRERPPLVVPATRGLPPPETRSLAKSNPAWATDPDVTKANEARKRARGPQRDVAQQMEDEMRPMRPDEL